MHKHFAQKLLNLPIDTKFRPGRQFTAGQLYHTFSRLSIGKIAKKIALMRERFGKFDEWQLQQNPASFRREICHFSQTRRFPFPAIFGGSCPQNAEYYTWITANTSRIQTRHLRASGNFWLCGSFLYALPVCALGRWSCRFSADNGLKCHNNDLHREILYRFSLLPPFSIDFLEKKGDFSPFRSTFGLPLLHKRQFIGIFTNFEGDLTLFVGDFDHFTGIFAVFGQKLCQFCDD